MTTAELKSRLRALRQSHDTLAALLRDARDELARLNQQENDEGALLGDIDVGLAQARHLEGGDK
jgi:hypothetical protein